MPTSESSPEKKSDTKNISDKKTFETVDLPLPPLKSLDATRAQEIGALSGFERTVLQSKVDPKKDEKEPEKKEEQGIMDSIHSAFASLSLGAKQGGSLLESGGKGASLGALTYLSLKISQSILNAAKGTWYGLKTLGAWTKNILHYLSFGYIAKAQPVEAPQYFTFGDDITKTLGGIVPFTTLGAMGGMGAGTDILGKGKEFVSDLLSSGRKKTDEVSLRLPGKFSKEKEGLLDDLPPLDSDFKAFAPLRRVIIAGESIKGFSSPYEAFNKGIAGDSNGKTVHLQKMPLSELIRRQELPKGDADRVFAAGAYQMCPYKGKSLISDAARSLGISLDTPFNQSVQDKIWVEYFLKQKRPEIWKYLRGKEGSVKIAADAVALEWACFSTASGEGAYDGSAGNQATVPYSFLTQALEQTKRNLG